MFEDLSKKGRQRRYLYNPVGGGPFPYIEVEPVPGSGVQFGDIVINDDSAAEGYDQQQDQFADIVVNSDEDVVIANSNQSFDMMQDAFADDMITSGDEGLGYAQAKRLKRKLGRNKRRLRVNGTYAVEAGTPYQFGAVTFSPTGALKGGVVGGILGGFLPKKIQLKTPAQLQAQRVAWADTTYGSGVAALNIGDLAGAKSALGYLYDQGGLRNPGKFGGGAIGAATQQARDYIVQRYQQLKAQIDAKASPAIVPTAPGAPAPAPTSASTDVTGAPVPTSIMQASASQPAVGVNQSASPTASESVAAAAQEDQTAADFAPQQAGLFSGIDLKDPKIALTLLGLGVFIFTQVGGGSRRRSRRR